jgi:hypothetical protein
VPNNSKAVISKIVPTKQPGTRKFCGFDDEQLEWKNCDIIGSEQYLKPTFAELYRQHFVLLPSALHEDRAAEVQCFFLPAFSSLVSRLSVRIAVVVVEVELAPQPHHGPLQDNWQFWAPRIKML